MELLTSVERGTRAMLMGKALSRTYGRKVVAYFNGRDGNTQLCCSFEKGECTVEKPFTSGGGKHSSSDRPAKKGCCGT